MDRGSHGKLGSLGKGSGETMRQESVMGAPGKEGQQDEGCDRDVTETERMGTAHVSTVNGGAKGALWRPGWK